MRLLTAYEKMEMLETLNADHMDHIREICPDGVLSEQDGRIIATIDLESYVRGLMDSHETTRYRLAKDLGVARQNMHNAYHGIIPFAPKLIERIVKYYKGDSRYCDLMGYIRGRMEDEGISQARMAHHLNMAPSNLCRNMTKKHYLNLLLIERMLWILDARVYCDEDAETRIIKTTI